MNPKRIKKSCGVIKAKKMPDRPKQSDITHPTEISAAPAMQPVPPRPATESRTLQAALHMETPNIIFPTAYAIAAKIFPACPVKEASARYTYLKNQIPPLHLPDNRRITKQRRHNARPQFQIMPENHFNALFRPQDVQPEFPCANRQYQLKRRRISAQADKQRRHARRGIPCRFFPSSVAPPHAILSRSPDTTSPVAFFLPSTAAPFSLSSAAAHPAALFLPLISAYPVPFFPSSVAKTARSIQITPQTHRKCQTNMDSIWCT